MWKSRSGRDVANHVKKRPSHFGDRLRAFKTSARKAVKRKLGRTDKLLIACTFLVLAFAGWFATYPTLPDQDRLARMNLIILALIITSLLLSFVKSVPAKWVGITFAVGNILLWVFVIYLGDPGGWSAIRDVFTFF